MVSLNSLLWRLREPILDGFGVGSVGAGFAVVGIHARLDFSRALNPGVAADQGVIYLGSLSLRYGCGVLVDRVDDENLSQRAAAAELHDLGDQLQVRKSLALGLFFNSGVFHVIAPEK